MKNMFGEFLKKRWLIVVALLYLILPVDLIADTIPLFGNVDDGAVLLAGLVKQYVDFQKENKKETK